MLKKYIAILLFAIGLYFINGTIGLASDSFDGKWYMDPESIAKLFLIDETLDPETLLSDPEFKAMLEEYGKNSYLVLDCKKGEIQSFIDTQKVEIQEFEILKQTKDSLQIEDESGEIVTFTLQGSGKMEMKIESVGEVLVFNRKW